MKKECIVEVNRILNNLSSFALSNTTCDKATAKAVLEHEYVFCRGDMRDIRVKHLGVGVYKVYSEQRPL